MDQPSTAPGPTTVPEGIPMRDELSTLPAAERPELLVITGMSGAGRTRAAAALEDLNWYVVDNLPPRLLITLATMMRAGDGVSRLAAVVDVRSGEFFNEMVSVIDQIRQTGMEYRIIFLEASDAELVRRFETVRRPHPLQGDGRVLDGIAAERALLQALKNRADVVIDTTELSVHDLARRIRELIDDGAEARLHLTVMSFGFKYGLPLDADHVVDVRFLANPYWVTELRHLTGHDEQVKSYVLSLPGATDFVDRYVEAIEPILGRYSDELKPYVTIAVGCTGGKHRSVAISEEVAARLRRAGHPVRTIHRDLGRE
ncbi:MAG: RNase adapter RapZ [Actinomycetes bacterium]|nr:RNase adapter RapZ [Actinomycetes bacterium]MDX5450199.1 RNase adapter RapZ [Actinomycetes bacterium]